MPSEYLVRILVRGLMHYQSTSFLDFLNNKITELCFKKLMNIIYHQGNISP